MQEIIEATFLINNESIILRNKGIDDTHFIFLLAKDTDRILKLNLCQNNLSPRSMVKMRQVKWNSLLSLNLGWNKIGDKGCKYLSRINIPHINNMSLIHDQISSFGVFHLTKAEWKNLQLIWLSRNKISFNGIAVLSTAKWSTTVQKIQLYGNDLIVCQFYRLFLCQMQKILWIWVKNDKVQECYKDKLRYQLKLKYVSAKIGL